MHYDENNIQYFDCNYCQDAKFIVTRNPETGKPEYDKKAKPCPYCNLNASPEVKK